MKLATCMYQFFDQYLIRIKGCSDQTIKAYRDAFGLFLPFAADRLGIKIKSLQIEHLSADLILTFLNHLESDRNNRAITRNHRLAAIKSLAKMIRLMYPQHRKLAETILAIPQKRTQKQLIGFLYPDEILKVFQRVELTFNTLSLQKKMVFVIIPSCICSKTPAPEPVKSQPLNWTTLTPKMPPLASWEKAIVIDRSH
jgi:site-specific recombinase XerD